MANSVLNQPTAAGVQWQPKDIVRGLVWKIAIATWLLMAVGSATRVMNAGLACPDSGVVSPFGCGGDRLKCDRPFRTIFVLPHPPPNMAPDCQRWGSIFNRFSRRIGRLDCDTTAEI